jgi:hypothetical protein
MLIQKLLVRRYFPSILATMLMPLLTGCFTASYAAPGDPVGANSLSKVTQNAIDKELELLQMATNLKLQTAPQSQWRERRWFAYSVTNQTLTVIGSLMNGCGRLQYRHTPNKAPKNLFVNASWIRIVANAVSIAGCAAESVIDLAAQRHERASGIDLVSYTKHAKKSLITIDDLIKQRSELISAEKDASRRELLMQENSILQDVRQCCADDLEEAYIRAKSVRASRYFQYSWVAASNAIGGGGTLANNVSSIHNKPPRFSWPGGVGDSISGSMNMVTPEAIGYAGLLGARSAGHPLVGELSFTAKDSMVEKFGSDLQAFRSTASAGAESGLTGRENVYEVESKILAQHFSSRPMPPKGTIGRVVGNFGSAVGGGGKLTNGIEVLVGSYKYPRNAQKRFENLGAGGIAYGAGVAVAEEETLRREFASEVRWHRLPKEKRPAQILKSQLAQLDAARINLRAGL